MTAPTSTQLLGQPPALGRSELALVELGRALGERGYRFVTVTPETHRRVLARDERAARSLRDVFGYSRPFSRSLLPAPLASLAEEARILEPAGSGLWRSRVRFSSMGDSLFAHSSYPTTSRDAVFFGPDTYRFCAFVERALPPCQRLVDVGCGSGAGGIIAAGNFGGQGGIALLQAAVLAALAFHLRRQCGDFARVADAEPEPVLQPSQQQEQAQEHPAQHGRASVSA